MSSEDFKQRTQPDGPYLTGSEKPSLLKAPESLDKVDDSALDDAITIPANPTRPQGILWVLSVAALYSTALLYGIDTTIVTDVQVPIIKAFGHVDQLTWIGGW